MSIDKFREIVDLFVSTFALAESEFFLSWLCLLLFEENTDTANFFHFFSKGAMTSDKKKPISRSSKAGLQFPVGRIHRYLKGRSVSSGRVGGTAAVYSAAILGKLSTYYTSVCVA